MRWLVPFVVFFLASHCRAQDPRTYWDERAKVTLLTDQQLIDCLRGPTSCPVDTHYYYVNDVVWTLADRKHPDLIIAAYKKADEMDCYRLVETLWYIDDPLVETFMRSIPFEHPHEGIDDGSSVFALDYLAQRCDLNALSRLNRERFQEIRRAGLLVSKRPCRTRLG